MYVCLFVCFFCTVTDFSAAEKRQGREILHACSNYNPDRSSPLLLNFGSREVTAVVLLPVCSWNGQRGMGIRNWGGGVA